MNTTFCNMKNRFLPLVFLLVFACHYEAIHAQNQGAEIIGPDILCVGECDTFSLLIDGVPPSPQGQYIWNVSNNGVPGPSFTTVNNDLFYCAPTTGPGTTIITVMYFGPNGTSITAEHVVTIVGFQPLKIISSNAAPCNADSTSNPDNVCEKVCPNTTITYSVTISGNPGGTMSPVTWQVTGASSFTVNPPFFNSVTVNWGAPGIGSVVVVSNGITGCYGEDALCVTVIDEPVAQFTSDPPAVNDTIRLCKGQTVYFQNQSTGADSYEWFFDDDLSTTAAVNPQHTFVNPGNYTVRLIARSDCLCSDTISRNVVVLDAEAPTLDCVGTICPGETVTYTASNACPPYVWSVTSNGTIVNGGTSTTDSIAIQWTAGPVGVITLGAQACSGNVCPDPASIQVPIISDDAEIMGEDQVCPAAIEIYSIEPYGGTGFVWTLSGGGTITEGQGTNRVTVEWSDFPNVNTTYWLSVVYDNCYLGCGGQDSMAIRILSSFAIDGPVEICEDATGNFVSKLTYNAANIVCNWTLTAPNGSTSWTSPAPTAAPAVPFYSGSGVYRLLAVPDNPTLSCSNEAEWVIRVAPQPAKPAGISGEPNVCSGTTYTYSATGIDPGNKLQWTVQNGPGAPVVSAGNTINVTWGAADPRWISVAQVSKNGLNCASDTTLLNIQSIGALVVNGTSIVCEDETEAYAILPLTNVDVQWSISPASAGSVAKGQGTSAAELFWTEPGGHVVTVNVCGQTALFPVTVNALPDPMVQHPAGICAGELASVQTGTPFSAYSWNDADGTEISTLAAPDFSAGSYFVHVTDPNGCVGTTEFTMIEYPLPNISLTTGDPTGFCNNSSFVEMTSLVNVDDDFVYEWFRDGNPLGVDAPTYSTNQYGSYAVQATNGYGCSATAGNIVLFDYCSGGSGGPGIPGAGSPPCAPGTMAFNVDPTALCDSFHFQLVPGPQYQPGTAFWSFGISGGGLLGTAATDNPGFLFPNAGIYTVVMRATLQSGATCVVINTVDVVASARFAAHPECPGLATVFEDASTHLPGNSIANWDWNFGDPTSGGANISNIRNPSHTYLNSGNPVVTLVITAGNGCTASAKRTIEIPEANQAPFSLPALNCAGNALEFIANITPAVSEVAWNFGDMSSGASNDATGDTVYHSFNAPSNYAVTTTATNAYGCTATFTQIINIVPSALGGTITPANPAPICEGTTITLTAPPGADTYFWSDSMTVVQSLTTGEEGTYSVTMTDAAGCTFIPPPVPVEVIPAPDALIKAILMNDLGQIVGTSYPTLSVCEGEKVHLIVQGTGAYGYTWSGGNGTSDEVVFDAEHGNQLLVGTHIFTVTVTDFATGCTSVTDPFEVTVHPVPAGFSISATSSCAGNPNVITYSGPEPPNWQLVWNTGITGNTLTTEDPGLFFIRVINEFGCEAKSNVVSVLAGPNVAAIPGGCHSRCRPDTFCLPPIPDIVSWQWYFNGNPVPGATGPDFVAQESGVYYAELTDINGCQNQSDPLVIDLYDGSGNIYGQVWSDVNGSGVIDAGDTLVSGITVNLLQNGVAVGNGQSNAGGDFSFINVLSTNYLVQIDSALLPPGWEIVIGENAVGLSGCGAIGNSALLLHICPPLVSTQQFTACANESIVFNGTPVQAGTTQQFMLLTPGGCDSMVVVTVDAIPTSGSTLLINVCPNEVYDYNGTLLSPGQSQDFVLQNYLGCDSVVTVSVTGVPASVSDLSVSICPGTQYDYNGTLLSAGQTQNFSFQNVWGCDSTVTVSVSALPVSSSVVDVSACPGGVYDYNGTPIPAGTSQYFVYQNYLGCDSTVTVVVDEAPVNFQIVDAVACAGYSLPYNGVDIPAGSSQSFVFQNIYGCDSIVEVSVAVLPSPPPVSWAVSVCPGETYTFNGVTLAAGDSASFTIPGTLGCDTVVAVHVYELQTSSSSFTVGVCPGETYAYQGAVLTGGTVQNFVLTNSVGCDSVVTVTVEQLSVSTETLEVSVCPGTTYDFNGTEVQAGSTQDFHFIGPGGCDSTITVAVSAFPGVSFTVMEESSCPNSPTGALSVQDAQGGLQPYRYSIDGAAFQDSTLFGGLDAGAYTVYLEDSNGCLFEAEADVAAYPALDISLSNGILPCNDPATTLAVEVNNNAFNLSFQWSNGDTLPFTTFQDVGPVWVEVTNACETVHRDAEVEWADAATGTTFLYAPNVMMPASFEPDNSQFKPYFQPGLEIISYQFEVYDRWGNRMFTADQPDAGWRGKFHGDDVTPGVYAWFVKAEILFCGHKREMYFNGDVTVVR